MLVERPPLIYRMIFPETVWRIHKRDHTVYLTFDDGPIPEVTPWVLDTLDRYSINVEYLYAFVSPVKGKAVVILRFDAPDVAVERLSADQAVKFVGPEDIFAGK